MLGRLTVRVIAVLLLLVAGGEVYACDVSDACVSASPASDGCDQPSGDNCLCCCHHIIPVPAFALSRRDFFPQEPFRDPLLNLFSVSLPIDHPPQL